MHARAIGLLLAVMLLIAACGPAAEPANGDTLISGATQAGYTPIDLSSPEAPRTIILLPHGEDTYTPPDPCEVAAKLREDGIDMLPERNPDAERTDAICPDVWLIDEVDRR